MLEIVTPDQACELLDVTATSELESWLTGNFGKQVLSNSRYWRNVGDQLSNAGAIEVSADEINPLVERIVNSIEAVIELRVADSGATPKGPRDAVRTLLGLSSGESSQLDSDTARSIAQDINVVFKGKRRTSTPTIEVIDRGIGIHPSYFSDTILALGQSLKGQKSYLIGMYGQGGSSTYDKCSYTIIVSRRHPDHLRNKERDQVGWTIVRKNLNVRAPVYSYLVDPDTKSVPVLSSSVAQSIRLDHGTRILHIEYRDTGGFATQEITNNAFYTLNYRLFNPLLPWTLSDMRGTSSVSRTMRGIPYRVGQLPDVTGIGSAEVRNLNSTSVVRHNTRYEHRLPSGSHLLVRWWVLQDERVLEGRRRPDHAARVRPYRDFARRYSRRVVSITRGGQTHAALTSNIFSRKGLRQIARSIVVQVDTDSLTFEEGASFFASNRADLKTASQDLVEEAINSAIDINIGELRAIEREREQELVAGRSASDEDRIRQHLDPMIRAFQRMNNVQGQGAVQNQRRRRQFSGRQVPTYIRFARTQTLEVRPGAPTRVDLLTDAADEVIRNRRTKFQIESNPEGVLRIDSPQGGSGRYRINLLPSADLAVGTRIEIKASITSSQAWYLETDPPCNMVVVPPPPPYIGQSPPTFIRFRSRNGTVHVRQGRARISLNTDATNDLGKNGELLDVSSPNPSVLPVLGKSGPRNGEFRVLLDVPENAPIGNWGEIRAVLVLEDGSYLDSRADLVIEPSLNPGGQTELERQPNYNIKDVREIPLVEDEISWEDMRNIFDLEHPWNAEDVAAYYETGAESQRQVTFYLNADNKDLRRVERLLAQRHSENSVDVFREMHRTLLCFHLYELASENGPEHTLEYQSYRDEMIRVNQTLLYQRSEFMDQPEIVLDEAD